MVLGGMFLMAYNVLEDRRRHTRASTDTAIPEPA